MSKKDLMKKLSFVGNVFRAGNSFKHMFLEVLPECKVIEYKFPDEHERYKIFGFDGKFDVTKNELWSTYEECISFRFTNDNGNLICYVTIYNTYERSLFGGHGSNKRIDIVLKVPAKFISNLSDSIENRFDGYMNDRYDEYLMEQREQWKKIKANQLLNPEPIGNH